MRVGVCSDPTKEHVVMCMYRDLESVPILFRAHVLACFSRCMHMLCTCMLFHFKLHNII